MKHSVHDQQSQCCIGELEIRVMDLEKRVTRDGDAFEIRLQDLESAQPEQRCPCGHPVSDHIADGGCVQGCAWEACHTAERAGADPDSPGYYSTGDVIPTLWAWKQANRANEANRARAEKAEAENAKLKRRPRPYFGGRRLSIWQHCHSHDSHDSGDWCPWCQLQEERDANQELEKAEARVQELEAELAAATADAQRAHEDEGKAAERAAKVERELTYVTQLVNPAVEAYGDRGADTIYLAGGAVERLLRAVSKHVLEWQGKAIRAEAELATLREQAPRTEPLTDDEIAACLHRYDHGSTVDWAHNKWKIPDADVESGEAVLSLSTMTVALRSLPRIAAPAASRGVPVGELDELVDQWNAIDSWVNKIRVRQLADKYRFQRSDDDSPAGEAPAAGEGSVE